MPAGAREPLLPASSYSKILHRRLPFKLNIKRTGLSLWDVAFSDVFQSLLDMPLWKFMVFFFSSYTLLYVSFAVIYYLQADDCIMGIQSFDHAVWFSVQSAATIGYGGEMSPNPDCFFINLAVTIQAITAVLINTSMMGVVFARFSSPMHRSQTIKFSSSLTMHASGGRMCLSCRVANLKAHGILNPQIRMLVTSLLVEDLQRERRDLARRAALSGVMDVDEDARDGGGPLLRDTAMTRGRSDAGSAAPHVGVQMLAVENTQESLLYLTLGLPATLTHVIDESSPLFGLDRDDIARMGLEVMVILDGVDPATSRSIQARKSFGPSSIRFGHQFAHVVTLAWRSLSPGAPGLNPTTSVRLNFEHFNATVDAAGIVHDSSSSEEEGKPARVTPTSLGDREEGASGMPGVEGSAASVHTGLLQRVRSAVLSAFAPRGESAVEGPSEPAVVRTAHSTALGDLGTLQPSPPGTADAARLVVEWDPADAAATSPGAGAVGSRLRQCSQAQSLPRTLPAAPADGNGARHGAHAEPSHEAPSPLGSSPGACIPRSEVGFGMPRGQSFPELGCGRGLTHVVLRVAGEEPARLEALRSILKMAADPETHATRPTLVLCKMKDVAGRVADALRKGGYRGVHMVAEPGAATDGRARIPAHVAAGKTSVLVAWVGYAPQLLETHATNVAVEVHFNVPSPDSYAKRTALVQDRGCIVTLSGGTPAEITWLQAIEERCDVDMEELDLTADVDRLVGLLCAPSVG